jgi:hypothetical protein
MFYWDMKWLDYYIRVLKNTDNYYETLRKVNQTWWCSEDFAITFMNLVQIHYSNYIKPYK